MICLGFESRLLLTYLSYRVRKAGIVTYGTFLKAFPMGPLLGMTSVMDLVMGSGSFFSAQSRTPVALVCWLRS